MAAIRSCLVRAGLSVALILTLAPGLHLAPAQQPGDLDLTFGGTGIVTTPTEARGRIRGLAVQADDKIVAVGEDWEANGPATWVIVRYQTNGNLDPSFGNGGMVILFNVEPILERAHDLVIDPAGRLVVVGVADYGNFAVVRLLADGSLDPSFGSGGIATANIGAPNTTDFATAVDLQADGKIVVGGTHNQGDQAWAIARFTADGSLDTDRNAGFGPRKGKRRTGYVIDDLTPDWDDLRDGGLLVQPDGRILVCGGPNGWTGWILARYLSDGTPDPSFGVDGKTVSEFGADPSSRVYGIALQGSAIIASGRLSTFSDGYQYAAARYHLADGILDPSFGTNGLAQSGPLAQGNGYQVVVQPDGKVLVGGSGYGGADNDFMVFRFLPDGTADPNFGTLGQSALAGLPGLSEHGYVLTQDHAGNPIVGGITSDGLNPQIALARYLGDAPPSTPPAAPTNLLATPASSVQIDLTWLDTAQDEDGFEIDHSPDGSNWVYMATLGPNITLWSDTDLLPNTTHHYRIRAFNVAGPSDWSNSAWATTPPTQLTDATTTADLPIAGTVTGTHLDTHTDDDIAQKIQEVESGGKPSKRHSYLEHKWTFAVTPGSAITFYLQAWHTANNEGDDFVFAWSPDDQTYTDMVTVTKLSDDDGYDTFALPSNLSGTIYIRVRDTDRTQGNRSLDTVFVDHVYIRSE